MHQLLRPDLGAADPRGVAAVKQRAVAVGLADYFDVDPVLVRVGFVVLTFVGGLAVPLYLAGWALIPDEDTDTSIAEEILARERTRSAY